MTDREKVIKGLEIQLDDLQKYADSDEILTLTQEQAKEIVAMLKEQEKAKVVFGRRKDGSFDTACGHCGMYLDKAYSICPKCNKELDWNSNQD